MKKSLSNNLIDDYKKQIALGNIPKAYKGLIKYLMSLRTLFINQYPTEFIVGNFYQGYMDMTYFPITTKSLKSQKIKIGLVFNHEKIQFELWLVGQNKAVQNKYWNILKSRDWNKYEISATAKESIIEQVLVKNPDFSHLDSLTKDIEKGTVKFIKDITNVLG